VRALLEEGLSLSREREALLAGLRARAEEALSRGEEAPADAAALLAPLVREGLLRQLRDPYFHARLSAAEHGGDDDDDRLHKWEAFRCTQSTVLLAVGARGREESRGCSYAARTSAAAGQGGRAQGGADSRDSGAALDGMGADAACYALPTALLPGTSWSDIVAAVDHEEGRAMHKAPLATADKRLHGKGTLGIFVVDHFGRIFCADKVRGVCHHSSLSRGHAVKFAGSLRVEAGRVAVITPHSGHYVPSQQDYDDVLADWAARGLDLSQTEVRGLVKEKNNLGRTGSRQTGAV